MKTFITCLLIITSLGAFSQTSKKLTTGDDELDKSIKSLTAYARKNGENFKAALVTKFGVSQEQAATYSSNYTGGDLYMIFETARTTGKTSDEVFALFNKNNGYKSWLETLKELGVKPGSKAFENIKYAVVNNGID